ncbi:phosphatidate cytidylyltransferase [Leptobacterium sp. I13]|uniref:phosphatidate cytidylyltransferase n=1 Tax=Leptobacterium meishanense TaxID=3128904 RepID=UPI0030EE775A
MKEFLKRSITGILYVLLLLAAVFLSTDAFDFLFLAFGLTCIYEFKKLIKLRGYYIFIAFMALWWLFIYLIKEKSVIYTFLVISCAVNIFLITFLFSNKEHRFSNTQKFLITLFYIGGGSIFLTMIPYKDDHFAKYMIISIFILIWVNDSFAFLVGKAFGKNKLFKKVSPKKTIEGALGGFIFALIAAFLLWKYGHEMHMKEWMILTFMVVIMGTLGDLIESKFKRTAGVKDSGAILPGHGGLLDRLDSLIFTAPFAYLTLQVFNYVS